MIAGWAAGTRAAYLASGIGTPVRARGRFAVLVVDLTYGFTDPESPAGWDATDVVTSTRALLDRARAHDVPCIFTSLAFPASRLAGELWLQKMPALSCLVEGGRWADVDARLAPAAHEEVVMKRAASAFADTSLDGTLRALGVEAVILCGATTSGCIRATAIDAVRLGYPTLVPQECVGDRAQGPHEASLFDIDAKYANVVTLAYALAVLEDCAA